MCRCLTSGQRVECARAQRAEQGGPAARDDQRVQVEEDDPPPPALGDVRQQNRRPHEGGDEERCDGASPALNVILPRVYWDPVTSAPGFIIPLGSSARLSAWSSG
jgi:hypothetical protein